MIQSTCIEENFLPKKSGAKFLKLVTPLDDREDD
jgi:hypothetical protein